MSKAIKPVQNVTNGVNGSFTFASIGYVVKENASDKLGGITYVCSISHEIVAVTDLQPGHISH